MPNPLIVAHITDLHVGDHSDAIWSALSDALTQLQPNFIVVSGDITERNTEHDFTYFLNWLKNSISLKNNSPAHGLRLGEGYFEKVVCVPGNHDYFRSVNVQGDKSAYFDVFVDAKFPHWRYIENNDGPSIFLVALDSSKPNTIANGEIEVDDLLTVKEWTEQARHGLLQSPDGALLGRNFTRDEAISLYNNSIKILVLHHYLYFPRARGKERRMQLKRTDRILAQIASDDFDVVLSGHDHRDIVDDPKYDNLLDERAVRRFARNYCMRQLGVTIRPTYFVDESNKLLKRSLRLALMYFGGRLNHIQDFITEHGFQYNGLDLQQQNTRRGVKDFISYDLSDPEKKKAVKTLATLLEDKIGSTLRSRTMLHCTAPSATKAREKSNGFYVYRCADDRAIVVEPYYFSHETGMFSANDEAAHEYSLRKATDLFKTEAFEELRRLGLITPAG
ncbi:calcineurin-like phosphoesterase family protein [Paraburkholderia sp. BL6669N2]|uniref:metallophosphoesterase family protein n=1 Tax=Paraburkholderia sp. BL6669N2 TaxID=1938807 RepID=UPI000E27C53D|nr:metallophosphoesterase [Paraburkholderia sp. BL6669N2]REG48567.1 calcineurin-like phosphoesterase family protein [Paraburkholderia sp. BL6669N2]